MRLIRDRERRKTKHTDPKKFEESFKLETSYDLQIQQEMKEQIDFLLEEYLFLRHTKCSALTGENVKTIFDEAIDFMLKKKSAELVKK